MFFSDSLQSTFNLKHQAFDHRAPVKFLLSSSVPFSFISNILVTGVILGAQDTRIPQLGITTFNSQLENIFCCCRISQPV